MDRYEKATMDLAGAGVTVHRISTYRELGEYRDDWATGRLGALPLYVCSRPQLGKSRHFAQVPGALHLRIHASAWGIYHRLWRHQKEQVVLDDLDSLLQDIAANALLKALMEDSPCRQLTWTTDNAKINRGEVPPAFDFEGRIAVLSNSWPRDPAVLSRAFAIWFAPDVEEVHDYAKTWLPKDGSQIWNYVGERLQYVPAPDLNRWYVQPCRLASIGRDWRRYLDGMLDAPEIRCLVELENRAGLTRRQKAAQWAKQTGESARTYYRKLTAYRASHPERDDKQAARDWNTCQHDSIVSTGMQARPAAVMLPSIGNGPASDSARQGEIQPRDDDEMPGAEVAPAPKREGRAQLPLAAQEASDFLWEARRHLAYVVDNEHWFGFVYKDGGPLPVLPAHLKKALARARWEYVCWPSFGNSWEFAIAYSLDDSSAEEACAGLLEKMERRNFGNDFEPHGPVKIVGRSSNQKTGAIATTYASQSTCPATCPFRSAGCYAEHGPAGLHTATVNASSIEDPVQIARIEVAGIDGLPADVDLRVHVVGDCPIPEAAELVGSAMIRYEKRSANGRRAWTYTHAWRTVQHEAWQGAHVLASCETLEDVREAQARGYATAIVVPEHPGHAAYEVGSATIIPCPAETRGQECVDCRLCMRTDKLRALGLTIGFTPHGSGQQTVRKTLMAKG